MRRVIGRGAFGVVYEALYQDRDDRVAVKVANLITQLSSITADRLRSRLAREVRLGKMLKHPRTPAALVSRCPPSGKGTIS